MRIRCEQHGVDCGMVRRELDKIGARITAGADNTDLIFGPAAFLAGRCWDKAMVSSVR